ncbi:MAG: hypothetical protein H6625_13755 [Bdellovibrionaceae bacterium]|nr:hypothetical protein [Pseudobdellovibrionaceae bacterium]
MIAKIQMMVLAVSLCIGGNANAITIQATEMNSDLWAKLTAGMSSELIVEFRQGDELPVAFSSKGDFLETVQVGTSYVEVKRDFWLKLKGNDVLMSLDGATYKPISDITTGSFSAEASSGSNGGPANAINLVLESYLK